MKTRNNVNWLHADRASFLWRWVSVRLSCRRQSTESLPLLERFVQSRPRNSFPVLCFSMPALPAPATHSQRGFLEKRVSESYKSLVTWRFRHKQSLTPQVGHNILEHRSVQWLIFIVTQVEVLGRHNWPNEVVIRELVERQIQRFQFELGKDKVVDSIQRVIVQLYANKLWHGAEGSVVEMHQLIVAKVEIVDVRELSEIFLINFAQQVTADVEYLVVIQIYNAVIRKVNCFVLNGIMVPFECLCEGNLAWRLEKKAVFWKLKAFLAWKF